MSKPIDFDVAFNLILSIHLAHGDHSMWIQYREVIRRDMELYYRFDSWKREIGIPKDMEIYEPSVRVLFALIGKDCT